MRRLGPAASSNSRSIFSVSRQISASLPAIRRKTSARGGRSFPSQYSTSKCSARRSRGSSNKTCVENSLGLLTASAPRKKQLGRVTQLQRIQCEGLSCISLLLQGAKGRQIGHFCGHNCKRDLRLGSEWPS